MEVIYYKVETIFCAFPFLSEVSERFVELYEKTKGKGSKTFVKINSLGRMNSDTSIEEKEKYLEQQLNKR
jgi:hypothetical protein